MKKRKHGSWMYIKRIAPALIVVFLVGAVVIKVFPETAAVIADNYLRPLIGTRRVAALEKFFLNTSDQADKLEYQFKNPSAPEFLVATNANTNTGNSNLELTSIPSAWAHRLKNEGVWQGFLRDPALNRELMAYTFVRPDPKRSYAIVSLVQMDMSSLRLGAVAGTKEPGGSIGNPGSGTIPQDVISGGNLVAAFNGGFLYVDGNYGMLLGGKTYAPLRNGAATIVGHTNGSLAIVDYEGQSLGSDVAFARQNGPMLINNGTLANLNLSDERTISGRVLHGGTYTWRSAIGLTKKGNLIYAAGNNVTPNTLAQALLMAGCSEAMELDINPSQVRFDTFQPNGNDYTAVPLNQELAYLSNPRQYLTGYTRDFFYVYKP